MSRVNPLPPQAFTKETLHKAYLWLNAQGPHIKELATTPELLVSLFLKAQRNGEESLNRPSIQNFKNELKSLAGMMGEFETSSVGSTNPSDSHVSPSEKNPSTAPGSANSSDSKQYHSQSMDARYDSADIYNYRKPIESNSKENWTTNTNSLQGLDTRSFAMIQEVKNQFNLSSETEALRLLISLGYSKAKTIL